MAGEVDREPEFRLRAFTEFDILAELLALPRAQWAALLWERGANLDHVEDDDLPDPEEPYSLMADDAWGLCGFLGLVSEAGLTQAGRTLLDGPDSPSGITGRIAARVEGWAAGPNGVGVAELLRNGVERVRGAGESLGGFLPGLLLGEMALLLGAARIGRPLALVALQRVEQGRRDVDEHPPKVSSKSEVGRKGEVADAVSALALERASTMAGGGFDVITATEARATAMLLIRSGLFVDVSPLGPVQCLAPPGPADPVPVLERDGRVQELDIGSDQAAVLMQYLHAHSFVTNKALVYPQLGLGKGPDPRANRKSEKEDESGQSEPAQGGGRGPLSIWRSINKGLAMEMLSAILLSRIDGAQAVFAAWQTLAGRPVGTAPARRTDLTVTYPETAAGGRFSVVAEVSAKREATVGFYRKQMGQALNHGRHLQSEAGGTVYALVVNGGRIASDARLQAAFRKFREDNELALDGPVRVVPICALDLAAAVRAIEEPAPGTALEIEPAELAGTFDRLLAGLAGTPPDDRNWMSAMLRNAAQAEPQLDAGGTEADAEPSGP